MGMTKWTKWVNAPTFKLKWVPIKSELVQQQSNFQKFVIGRECLQKELVQIHLSAHLQLDMYKNLKGYT